MKQLIIILLVIVLVGCGKNGEYTNGNIPPLSIRTEKCFNGVVYYNTGQGIAPAFKPDGSLYTCENKIKEN